MFALTGKSCVVTGASRGLGRAIALAFADQGADVILAARSRGDLEQVRAEIETKGRRAVVQPTDVTDVGQLHAAAEAAARAFGRLDVWVNNAGGDTSIASGWAEWLDVSEAGWDRPPHRSLARHRGGPEGARRLLPSPPRGRAVGRGGGRFTSPPTRRPGCRARCPSFRGARW